MEKYKRLIYIFLVGIIGIALLFLFFKYALGILLPFLISFVVVSMLRPIIDKICAKTRAPKPFVAVFTVSLAMILIITLIVLMLIAIANQVGNIFDSIIDALSREENFVTRLFDVIEKIEEKIPFLKRLTNDSLVTVVTEMITDGVKALSLRLTTKIAGVIASIPQIMLTVIVVFLSLFYFAKDYDKIGKKITDFLPQSMAKKVLQIKKDVLTVVTRFIKSYMLLLLMTFAQLFAGFLILGIENSFVLALIIAVVDILPILGVGTVLVPWAVILFTSGQNAIAIGLLVMFGIIYVVRQYAEPRIVSAQMDVHPLITLGAMYAGLRLAGILGLIFSPLVVFIIKTSYQSYKKTVDNGDEM